MQAASVEYPGFYAVISKGGHVKNEDAAVAPFVIITPAHNEAPFIEKTILSMVNQNVRPLKWIIVNDNSADRTGEIADHYAQRYDFIQVVNVERAEGRHFGNKVRAFNRGLAEAEPYDFRYIGNLDADISLGTDYFENILREFDKNPRLGIAGGMVSTSIGGRWVSQEVAPDSVAGAVQLFRRACFERIGGYLTLPLGGIDAAAEIMARMNGWETRTFRDLRVFEHRRTGTATTGPLQSRIRQGRLYHSLGYDFLFLLLRCTYRLMDPPAVMGSIAVLYGYVLGTVMGHPRALPSNVVLYLRAEQRGKLRAFIGGLLGMPGRG
jgi:biofilm PGA synthesis N-glycosyltransferase PgaC